MGSASAPGSAVCVSLVFTGRRSARISASASSSLAIAGAAPGSVPH
jgi:hypothetical protein